MALRQRFPNTKLETLRLDEIKWVPETRVPESKRNVVGGVVIEEDEVDEDMDGSEEVKK